MGGGGTPNPPGRGRLGGNPGGAAAPLVGSPKGGGGGGGAPAAPPLEPLEPGRPPWLLPSAWEAI